VERAGHCLAPRVPARRSTTALRGFSRQPSLRRHLAGRQRAGAPAQHNLCRRHREPRRVLRARRGLVVRRPEAYASERLTIPEQGRRLRRLPLEASPAMDPEMRKTRTARPGRGRVTQPRDHRLASMLRYAGRGAHRQDGRKVSRRIAGKRAGQLLAGTDLLARPGGTAYVVPGPPHHSAGDLGPDVGGGRAGSPRQVLGTPRCRDRM
jgi:hypothetical protein